MNIDAAPCIFCRIIAGQLPATVIAQTNDLVVIKDIAPKAPVHYLIIPKKHIHDLSSVHEDDIALLGHITLMAKQLASGLSGSQAFRLVTNNGADVGQIIFHLHFHFLSGKRMFDL